MKLDLRAPSGWRTGERWARADDLGLRLEWSELVLLPDRQDRWMDAIVRAGGEVAVLVAVDGATETGWPMRIVESELRDADGAVIEVRAHAFYAFFEHAAWACLRAVSRAAFDDGSAVWRAALASGRPDFSGAVAAVAQLYDL